MRETFTLLPIQIIEDETGLILRRGQELVQITSVAALPVILLLQQALMSQPLTREELLGLFAAPHRPLIGALLDLLIQKRFLVAANGEALPPSTENARDIFYWHFNQYQSGVASRLNEKSWAFVGINQLTGRLLADLTAEGLENIHVIDDPALRHVDLFDDNHQLIDPVWRRRSAAVISADAFRAAPPADLGLVVAASEFGSLALLEPWNSFAVQADLIFYPVLLQNMIGYAGPLTIPGETPCLACLKARQNSTTTDFAERRRTEIHAFAGQKQAAYHPAMLTSLAAVAGFDLIKFWTNIQWEVGTLGEIDLLHGTMSRRKLLKAPRCPVCSGVRDHSQISIYRQLTSDQAWAEIRQTVGYHGE